MGVFKYREFIAKIKYQEKSSPVYCIAILLLSIMIIIECFPIFNQNKITKLELSGWNNQEWLMAGIQKLIKNI